MIIECPKCGTKYKFDRNKVTEEGIWVRCKRCQKVFFQRRPADEVSQAEPAIPSPETAPLPAETDEKFGMPSFSAQEDWDSLRKEAERDKADVPDEGSARRDQDEEFLDEDELRANVRPRKNLWTPGKITIYIAILFVVMGGVYLSVFPDVSRQLIAMTPIAKFFGIDIPSENMIGVGVDLLNVRERFVENRMVGSLMVIEGYAVNRNNYPISKIKVRAKLLDGSGDSVGESEAYCGDLLSEEELSNLTEKEVRAELTNPLGKRVPNANIAPNGNIPFMIIFFNSPQRAAEYIVEVAEMEKSLR